MTKISLSLATLLMAGNAIAQSPSPEDVTVGQEICTGGVVMDEYCIDFGLLLDNQQFATLEAPQEHSMHCLVDVPLCYNTPFHILKDPAEEGGEYGPGWAVNDNTELMALGRRLGSKQAGCTTCDGTGTMVKGMRAEVRGTVVTLDPPVVSVSSVKALAEGEQGCGDEVAEDATSNMEEEATTIMEEEAPSTTATSVGEESTPAATTEAENLDEGAAMTEDASGAMLAKLTSSLLVLSASAFLI